MIGIASTAPAYSLAASIGLVSEEVGVKAPLIMILAFIPILFISYAYRALDARHGGLQGAAAAVRGSLVLGVVLMVIYNIVRPAYFRGEVVPGADVEFHDDTTVRNP